MINGVGFHSGLQWFSLAVCAAFLSGCSSDASSPRELKFGHVGEPGSLFALSADEFATVSYTHLTQPTTPYV